MTALALAFTNTAAKPASPTRPNRAARDALVTENLGLVHVIAGDIRARVARFVPREDLVGYGSIGLIEAAERFDPSGHLPFSAFARYRIRGAIFDGIRSQGASHNGLTYSRDAFKQIAAEARANRLLEQEALAHCGEIASPEQALAYVDDVLTKLARVHALSSVDDDESDSPSEGRESDGNRWNGAPMASDEEAPVDTIAIREAMPVLTPKQRKLIELVYGQDMDLFEAARALGIQSGTVTKLHQRALAALRSVIAPEEVR